jgi:hypothetical protein
MAESVEAPESGGIFGRIKGAVKRIKPGEWALIAVGVAGIVVYIFWYRNQQAANGGNAADALVPASGSSNPSWGSADASPNGTFQGEIADLLSSIASGAASVPGTTLASATGGSAGSGGTSVSSAGGSIAGSAAGTSMAGSDTGVTNVPGGASSGSGISQQGNNSSPIMNTTQLVSSPAVPLGTVGTTIPTFDTNGNLIGTVRVPANVTSGSVAATGGVQTGASQTAGSIQTPTVAPVNVVTSIPASIASGGAITHAAAPNPTPAPPTKAPVNVTSSQPKATPAPAPEKSAAAPAKISTPTKAPANVRPS